METSTTSIITTTTTAISSVNRRAACRWLGREPAAELKHEASEDDLELLPAYSVSEAADQVLALAA